MSPGAAIRSSSSIRTDEVERGAEGLGGSQSHQGRGPDRRGLQEPEDVPKHLEEPKKPSADRVLQQQRRLRQGQAKKAQEKKDAAEDPSRSPKRRNGEAAKSGARNG